MSIDLEEKPLEDDENLELKTQLKTQPKLGGSGNPPRIATDLMGRDNPERGSNTYKKTRNLTPVLAGLAGLVLGVFVANDLNDYIFQNNNLLQGVNYVASGTLGYLSFKFMAKTIF